MKRYEKILEKILYALLLILLSPFLLFMSLCLIISVPFLSIQDTIQDRKKYKRSHYYRDFRLPYRKNISDNPYYLLYNAMKERGLAVEFVRQKSNDWKYCIFEGTIYLFPDFDKLKYFSETKEWKLVYRKYSEESYQEIQSYLDVRKTLLNNSATDLPIKIMVERQMIDEHDLSEVADLPSSIFVVKNYQTAFDKIDWEILSVIPQTAQELYDMLQKTPDLCGSFQLVDGERIDYELNDLLLEIDMDCISVCEQKNGKTEGLTHWHPDNTQIYDDICNITRKGNVFVVKTFCGGASVLYAGDKKFCPYTKPTKKLFSRIYLFEAQ